MWYQSLEVSMVVNNIVLKIFRSYRMKINLFCTNFLNSSKSKSLKVLLMISANKGLPPKYSEKYSEDLSYF